MLVIIKRLILLCLSSLITPLHQSFRDAYRNVDVPGTIFKVDLSKATYMDSSALGMILAAKRACREERCGKVM